MKKKNLAIFIFVLVSVISLAGCKKLGTTVNTDTVSQNQQTNSAGDTSNFENIKTPHFVSSDPSNNDTSVKAPENISIVFNFNLVTGSKISVKTNGQEVTTASAKISADKLSMTVPVSISSSGSYIVSYTVCWPDGSCHNGSFGFIVKLP